MSAQGTPGLGSARLQTSATSENHYVYAVRSRRTGAHSIGVDLCLDGECPWSCDYCQVPGSHPKHPPEPVDLSLLRRELDVALAHLPSGEADIAFAGAGEPTWSPSFVEALACATARAECHSPAIPVRVFTCGSTLGRAHVLQALTALVERGAGEVWIKLDGWDDRTLLSFAGIQGQQAHEARILGLAQRVPVVIQTMLAHRPRGPTLEETACGLASAIGRLLHGGARIDRVVLSTVLRRPGNPADVKRMTAEEIERVAKTLRFHGVRVMETRIDAHAPSAGNE